MNASERGRVRLVDVVAAAFIGIFVAALFLFGLMEMSGRRVRFTCASRLRQFGIAFTNYATQNTDVMPPGNRNVWWYLLPYMAVAPLARVGDSFGTTNDTFRCPQDTLNEDGLAGNSYAFNCTTFLTEGQARANAACSPFSTGQCHSVPGVAKHYSSGPADTYLMMDYWGRDAYHHLQETYGLLALDDPENPIKHALRAPPWTDNPWTVTDAERYAVPDQDTVTLPKENVHEWTANFRGKPFADALHGGKFNMLSVDGHVGALDVRNLATTPPGSDPRWTGLSD